MAIRDKKGNHMQDNYQIINHVSRLCEQKVVEKSLIVSICGADKRSEKCCGV